MATRTFHISFPVEWAKEIEKEIKNEHYSVSEYFKRLYREYREEQQVYKDLEESEKDYREGRVITGKSLKELIKKK